MKRRGHATPIYHNINGRGLISKNSIVRAPFLCVHGEERKLTEKVAILAKLAKLTYCR